MAKEVWELNYWMDWIRGDVGWVGLGWLERENVNFVYHGIPFMFIGISNEQMDISTLGSKGQGRGRGSKGGKR